MSTPGNAMTNMKTATDERHPLLDFLSFWCSFAFPLRLRAFAVKG
jgi:hypothetical protein